MKVGQVCIKTKGHDAGGECVVIEVKEKEHRALVTGPKAITGVRRRYVNISHLKPTSKVLAIKPNASDNEIALLLGKKISERPRKEKPAATSKKKAVLKKKETKEKKEKSVKKKEKKKTGKTKKSKK